MRGSRAALRGLAAALVLAGAACDGGDRSPPSPGLPVPPGPVLVVGVDGLEWDVLLPLLRDGRLPHLEALLARGDFGELRTFEPTWSPVIWTSVATGKVHAKHGIRGFARRVRGRGLLLYDSTDRRTKALWNILSDAGRRVNVVGWWMTFPVEAIEGVMVAQTNTRAQLDLQHGRHVWKGTLREGVSGQVHPPERHDEMMAILEESDRDLPELVRRVFGTFEHPLSLLGKRLWGNCMWSFRADATYLRIALKLARDAPPADVTLVYLGGPDVVGHRFWRYMQPELFESPPTPEEIANFGDVIEDYYLYADDMLGRLVAAYGPETTVLLLSDHGMQPTNRDARFDPADPPSDVNSGAHEAAEPGVFVAAGPPIRGRLGDRSPRSLARGELGTVGGVLDLVPTLLAMLRIPIGQDMDGRVMTGIFEPDFQIGRQPPAVASHDGPAFMARPHPSGPRLDASDEERLEQLRALGYAIE